MSDATPEAEVNSAPAEGDGVDLSGLDLEATLAAVMDTLVPEEDGAEGAQGAPETPAAPAGTELPAPEGEGAPAGEVPAATPTEGDSGSTPVVPAPAGDPTGFDAAELDSKWGEVTTGLETRQKEEMEQAALAEIREEHAKYFEALNKHPRELAGMEVPSIKGEGMETLRDGQDAREWQEAIKQILLREVSDRVARKQDDVRPMMETLHNSVALFQNNPDLIPGSKQFDKELANQFATLAKPYELRVGEKLVGYTVPVQGLVTQIRQQLNASRTAAPAAPAAPSAQQQRAAEQSRNTAGQFTNPDAPQAGIPSKAGNSGEEGEDFSTLFGAYGLPNLRI